MIYECGVCRCTDAKLWRIAATSAIELVCWRCLEAKGHSVDLSESDQIWNPEVEGWSWLPAVPDLNGNFWGYTSVPSWWVAWWKGLPDTRDDCTLCKGSGRLAGDVGCFFCKETGSREVQMNPEVKDG